MAIQKFEAIGQRGEACIIQSRRIERPSGAPEEVNNLATGERLRATGQADEFETLDGKRRFKLRRPRCDDARLAEFTTSIPSSPACLGRADGRLAASGEFVTNSTNQFAGSSSVAKEKGDSGGPPADTPESILKLTVAGNLASGGAPGVDVYKERNAILEQRRKARVFYDRKTGLTRPGYSAEHLRNDCERRSTDSHSDSLARTIKNKTGIAKPTGAAAHHIVSSRHREAEGSRTLLFGWGIGINDADNGVYLRDIKFPCPSGLEKATIHDHIHSFNYHFNVLARLLDVADEDAAGGRKQLKTIKGEILTDQFPYRKQL